MSKARGRPILTHLWKLSFAASSSRKPSLMLSFLFSLWIKSLPVCPQISLCSSASPSWYSSSLMTTITSHYSVRSSGIRGKSSLTLHLQYLAQGLAGSRCSTNVVIWLKGREEEGKEERKGDGTLWELHFLFEIRLIIICPSVHRWQLKSGFYFL